MSERVEGLRQRSRRVGPWGEWDEPGDFDLTKRELRRLHPSIEFEHEHVDPDSGVTEASIEGFCGKLSDLYSDDNSKMRFYVEDGRVVIRYDPNFITTSRVARSAVPPYLVLSMIAALFCILSCCLFVYLNQSIYIELLMYMTG
jgi:hypothetical protein